MRLLRITPGTFSIAVSANQTGIVPTLNWSAISPDGSGASTQWAVTFSGSGVTGGSIGDGVYDLALNSTAVTSEANPTVPAQIHSEPREEATDDAGHDAAVQQTSPGLCRQE